MAKTDDILRSVTDPDRVFYQTGVMLNSDDFFAEQNYHRGRLARALKYTNGTGTLAGLKVEFDKEVSEVEADEDLEKIIVKPGLAIDRLGRQIEVSRSYCLRISRWYNNQSANDLRESWHQENSLWQGSVSGVVVDVFIKFISCEIGKTPSFSAGPFDSIDTVTTSRLRDSSEIDFIMRKESEPGVPLNKWPDFSEIADGQKATVMRKAIFDAWDEGSMSESIKALEPQSEHAAGQDSSSLFLARVIIPADEASAGNKPERRDENIVINNSLRLFVITNDALLNLLDIRV